MPHPLFALSRRLRVCGALAVALLVGSALEACGGAPPVAPVLPATCAVRLPPGGAAVTREGAPPPPLVVPRATLLVHAEVPLGGLREQLEAKVPRRVVDERNQDIGVAGRLEVTVDRGAFAVRVEGDALVVETPLRGQARACAKGSCYASCDPEAKVVARIPMRLGADYKFRASDVRFDVTRGCKVRALGGFVTVDVTPALRARLAQEAKQVQASIDRELPDFSGPAARLWGELGKPRELPLGACIVVSPEEIVQGPASGTIELARLRFGLLARPEIRSRCGEPPRPRALPPLRDDPALPPSGDVHLAVVLAPEAPARAVGAAGGIADLGKGKAQVREAKGDLATGLGLELSGDVCGGASVFASGATWPDANGVRLSGVALAKEDAARLGAAGLDAGAIGRAVEAAAIPVPLAVDQLGVLLPELAKAASDERTTVTVAVESAQGEGAGLRGAEVVAVVRAKASLTVRTK
ncbi:MAG: DUF4403 family protein [Deltaproteobacteria bacterium]|nr:DUF4403 family protein [Deltaproteobacteria bacterium]